MSRHHYDHFTDVLYEYIGLCDDFANHFAAQYDDDDEWQRSRDKYESARKQLLESLREDRNDA